MLVGRQSNTPVLWADSRQKRALSTHFDQADLLAPFLELGLQALASLAESEVRGPVLVALVLEPVLLVALVLVLEHSAVVGLGLVGVLPLVWGARLLVGWGVG